MGAIANSSSLRIVPKNLLFSAQQALSESAVREQRVTESNLRDLCTLITLSVLYDQIETLGNTKELDTSSKPHIAVGYDAIRDMTGLCITVGPKLSEFDAVLDKAIPPATTPFAEARRNVTTEGLRQKLAGALRADISGTPDYWEDLAEGRRLALSKDVGDASTEAEKFWLRTFLYAGLARHRKRPFVPDTIRSWDRNEDCPPNDYSRQLIEAVDAKYSPERVRELVVDSPIPIPPFPALVFHRTGGDRRKIPQETRNLRCELETVREALTRLQRERETADYSGILTLFGRPHTAKSLLALDDRTRDAFKTLRDLKIPGGIPPLVLRVKPVFEILMSTAKFILNLATIQLHQVPGAIREIATKLTEFEKSQHDFDFAEIHSQLAATPRAWLKGGVRTDKLFGTIRKDNPSIR